MDILLIELEEEVQRDAFILHRKFLRDTTNPFEVPEERFIELYRMPKIIIIEEIIDVLRPHMNGRKIPIQFRILATLRFFASGNYQRSCGQDIISCMSQSSISRAINEVSSLIEDILFPRWIKFPQTNDDKLRVKAGFDEKFNIPGVIGCIDCTHVEIRAPSVEEHNYVNRKGFHSKNVQIICDSDLNIININSRYPGACHDSFIWKNSRACRELERCFVDGDRESWLLGDSGYGLQPWLLTPVLNAGANTPEERYNVVHSLARNTIERLNGILKMRYRCLSSILHYTPRQVGMIINSCATLHNICTKYRIDVEIDNFINNDDIDIVHVDNNIDIVHVNNNVNFLNEGRRIRSLLIRYRFQ